MSGSGSAPEYRTVGLGDLSIAYLDTGTDGDPILLIHGFASNAAVNWQSTGWIESLAGNGRRVIALDNRGHGGSTKFYAKEDYDTALMAADALALLDHLGVERADVMGYSMGARIAAIIGVTEPLRARSVVLGGIGAGLIEGNPAALSIAAALEAPTIGEADGAVERMFRRFAERTKSDLPALAACMRGQARGIPAAVVARLEMPVLVAAGTDDAIAGDPHPLAARIPGAEVFMIEGRDHMFAVGDRSFKRAVLDFLSERP